MTITNLERVKIEVRLTMPNDHLSIYLEKEGLKSMDAYDSSISAWFRIQLKSTF